MPFKIEATPEFLSEAKKLSKKYQSLKKDIATLAGSLATKPQQGTSLGKNIYKVRMVISSKGKGKSGGARVITLVRVIAETVYLVSIYDKSEQSTITDLEIKERIRRLVD